MDLDVIVPLNSNKPRNVETELFCWRLEGHWQKEKDPLVRGTDPRIRIRNKMSQIQNTALN